MNYHNLYLTHILYVDDFQHLHLLYYTYTIAELTYRDCTCGFYETFADILWL